VHRVCPAPPPDDHRVFPGKRCVDFFKLFEQIDCFLNALFNHFTDGLVAINQRLLLEEADAVALGEDGLAIVFLVDTRHDLEQGRLTGTVETKHADLGAIEIGEGNVLDDRLAVVAFVDAHHRVDDFFGIFAHKVNSWLKCC
jgi:hypothetical protein